MTASVTIAILISIILALGAIASWTARKALAMNAAARNLATKVVHAESAIDHWHDIAKTNEADAEKWRLARDARRRNRTQAQRTPILAKMAEMRGDG